MKTETKISSIALVCALCAVVATPAMSAAPVRALGGAGTFSSASSAASSKTSGATSTRAGSLRVLPSTTKATTSTTATTSKPESAGAATTSTRALATPRLSLGKYLAGNRVVASTGGSTGGVTDGEFVAKGDWGDHLSAYENLVHRVEGLADDVNAFEGRVDVLEEKVAAGVASDEDVKTLRETVTALQTNVNTIVTQLPADGEEVASAESVTQINTTVTNINTTIEQLQEQITKIEGGDSSVSILELEQSVETLQDDVSALKLDVLNVQGEFAKYVLDTELEEALKTVDDEALIAALRSEYEAKVAELENDITTLTSNFTNYYTKSEVDKAIADAAFDPSTIDLTDYAKTADLEKFALTSDLEAAEMTLSALIDTKIATGDFAAAKDLEALNTELSAIVAAGVVDSATLASVKLELSNLIKANSDQDVITAAALDQLEKALDDEYYTSAQVDALLAQKVDVSSLDALDLQKTDTGAYKPLGALAYENEIKAEQITSINATSIQGKITTEQIDSLDASKITGEITNDQLASGAVTADKITTGDAVLVEGDLAMLLSDGKGGVTWQSVGVATGSDGK
ncbi:MAG: hypothetical protein IKB05_03290 [Alphaproteobacteria bacterium]|nr:hypothetical protein [Alphaproteobacteria bacterium]